MVLRLTSGSSTPSSASRNSFSASHVHQRDVVVVAEQRDDLLGLAEPQQAVIDEHAGELLADRLVDQHRRDRRIDAAREAADHPALADLRADLLDRLVLEGAHGPVAAWRRRSCARSCAAAPRRAACARPPGGTGSRRTCASRRAIMANGAFAEMPTHLEAGRQLGDAVAVAHPDRIVLALAPDALEQRGCRPSPRPRRGRTRGDGRPRPCRRAAPPSSARRSRCRAPARRRR